MDIHEIGHVLGLAHSPATTDIMYPMIARQVRPSARDVASARRFVQPCVA
jgi:predicted Zn-dependent protease